MPQEVYDFHKIFSKENLEDSAKTGVIRGIIENQQLTGFFVGCKPPPPTGIVLDYDVDEVKEQIGLASGAINDPEREFKRSGFNAIQRRENNQQE